MVMSSRKSGANSTIKEAARWGIGMAVLLGGEIDVGILAGVG
jgi:hypothetical protein